MKTILVTGGAGFVGSHVSLALRRQFGGARVVALDNLRRRGSELNLPRLAAAGVEFLHGDVRNPEDLEGFGELSLLVECSAEASVMAGTQGSPGYVIQANLTGMLNCLELARRTSAAMVFLSSSRVYPIKALNGLALREEPTRFAPGPGTGVAGFSEQGIAEDFPLAGARSLYGATKLAGELMLQEYVATYGLRAVINRCGLLTGPWQMAKSDQGLVALWVARHLYRRPLAYIGYGGTGKQVRDILHIDDLCTLLLAQLARVDALDGAVYNVGGGTCNASLRELTDVVQEVTGLRMPIGTVPANRPGDIPFYVSDCRKVEAAFGWRPQRQLQQTVEDITRWIRDNQGSLEPVLAG